MWSRRGLRNGLLIGLAREIHRVTGAPVVSGLTGEDLFVDFLPEPHRGEVVAELRRQAAELAGFVAPSRYYAERNIRPEGTHLEDWLAERWYRVGGVPGVPILPLVGGLKHTLILHDVHHLVTGYDTDWDGELQLAGWELASGGCGWSVAFWFDRLGAFLAGPLTQPRPTLRAFARGPISCCGASWAASQD